MSMLKTVPDGLKAREFEQIKLRKLPPVPYVPVKDEVQDEVARMRKMKLQECEAWKSRLRVKKIPH